MWWQLLAWSVLAGTVFTIVRCSRRNVESAMRLQAVALASIGDAVITTDTAGMVTFMNPEAERLTGVSRAEGIGRALDTIFHAVEEDTHAMAANPVHATLETGRQHALSSAALLVDATATERPIESKVSPIRAEDGSVSGVVLIFRDCTVRRKTEAALRDRVLLREQLARIAETAPGVICAYRVRPDGSSCCPYASPRITDVYGLTAEELAHDAAPAFGAIHPDDLERIRIGTAESARRLEQWHGEFRVNHPVRGQIWVEGWSMPELEPDGSVLWRGFLADVTGRKFAEAALVDSEERFRQIADNIAEVFWLTDPDNRQMMYVSPAFETIWGQPRSVLTASPRAWADAIHPDDRERALAASALKERTGELDDEYRLVRPDGAVRWIRYRPFPVRDAGGHVIRIAGVAADITEQHQLESELRQAQKMESVGLLAGGVAHDFNNVLTVIMGATELLAESGSSAASRETLDEIRHATHRAAALTRQLLAFSRKEVTVSRIVDFNALVAETERMLRRLLGEDIELVSALDASIAPVRIDTAQWEQVLVNLAVNARDAMSGGGKLVIATRDVTLAHDAALTGGACKPGRYVEVSVSDTGAGMAPDVLSRIFEPFFTTKDAGHGTGLGLAVVYGIVTRSGGGIHVHSEVNTGTTFTMYVPAANTSVESAPAPVRSSAGRLGGSETILIVEDEHSLRRMAVRILERQGYTVLQAGSGVEALTLLQRHGDAVDLVVTDVVMPGMDGRELTERIKERHPSVGILFTSGYTEDAVVRRGVETASLAFLQKPYAPVELTAKVRAVLDRTPAPVPTAGSSIYDIAKAVP